MTSIKLDIYLLKSASLKTKWIVCVGNLTFTQTNSLI